MKERVVFLNLYAGLAVFALSWVLLFLGLPFMKTWFFCFAWWSFILILDSLNFRLRGSSPLSRSPALFFSQALFSAFVWLVFELVNLRLRNWSYSDLPASRAVRWTGYLIAFASVIPALEELALLAEPLLANKLRLFRIRVTPFLLRAGAAFGFLSLLVAMAWPRIFFPLPWLCFIFLLEPLNYRLHNRTLLAGWEKKEWQGFWSWALAGLAAGFFWEFFNFWAGSRWQYHLPFLNFGRIFEMPAFGYTGFPPFALEVFAFVQLFLWGRQKLEKKNALVRAAVLVGFGLFCAGALALIDRFTLVG
jgi:hypothetical protein